MDSSSPESFEDRTFDEGNRSTRRHRQPTETPKELCARGCGFFTTKANRGFCSKCYQDFLMEECMQEKSGASVTDLDRMITPTVHRTPSLHTTRKRKRSTDNDDHSEVDSCTPTSINHHVIKKRCISCSNKVGLLGFECKCKGIFCGVHRHPEAHSCRFDFKTAGKLMIMKENPVCKGDKMKDRV